MIVNVVGIWDDGSNHSGKLPKNPRRAIEVPRGGSVTTRLTGFSIGGHLLDFATLGATLTQNIRKPVRNSQPLISRLGVPTPGGGRGRADFTIQGIETKALETGQYIWDIWMSQMGHEDTLVASSPFLVLDVAHDPNAVITGVPPVTIQTLGIPAPPGILGVQLTESPIGTLSWQLDPGFDTIFLNRVIAQPADGSDFVVSLPVTQLTNGYKVEATQADGAFIVGIQCPKGAGDRTVNTFRCITTTSLANGDSIDFVVGDGGGGSGGGAALPDVISINAPNPLVVVGTAVYLSAADTVDLASATSMATAPAVGFVFSKAGIVAKVLVEGELDGFVGLTPGATYFLDTVAGGVTNDVSAFVSGNLVQKVGVALDATTLLVSMDRDFIVL